MNSWKKAAVAVVIVAMAVSGGAAIARQSTDSDDPPQTGTVNPAVKDIGNGITETKYIPISPCRIVDTRVGGGQIAENVSRSFKVRGASGFDAQGGSHTGCGIPTSASAMEVAVTTVEPTDRGYMRIFPAGTTEPKATFINYSPYNPTNTGAVTLCATNCFAGDVTVKSHEAGTDLVMDVQGYYVKPMAALITYDSSVITGSRVTGTAHPNTGGYDITFDRSLAKCIPVVSPWFSGYKVFVQQNGSTVHVTSFIGDNTLADTQFLIQVDC
jgi:hypothetical protein